MTIKVLAIEDNPTDLKLLDHLLKHATSQFEVDHANTLEQAKEILAEEKFDVLLLELELPDSSGLATFRKIAKFANGIPIILVSGTANESMALTAVQEGAQDYLVKGQITTQILAHAIIFAIQRSDLANTLHEFSQVVENFKEAVLCKSLDGTILSWNKAAADLYGYTSEEVVGRPISILMPDELKGEQDEIINRVLKGESVIQYETVRQKKNGQIIDVAITVSPIKNKVGKIIALSVLVRNITSQKTQEQQLAIQYRVALALTEAVDLNTAAKSILKTICQILNWQMGEIWAVDKSENVLTYVASHFVKENHHKLVKYFTQLKYPQGHGLPGYIWETKDVYWEEDLAKSTLSNRKEKLLHAGFKSIFGFPILFKDEVLGVILFFGEKLKKPKTSFLDMFIEIGNQIGVFIKKKRFEGDLLYLAQHDLLTGLGNRIVIEDSLSVAIEHAKQKNKMVALIYLDLDYFKEINDKFGHVTGDLVLQAISERLRTNIRQTDVIGRFGGDEFIIILQNLASKENVEGIAKKLINCVEKPINLQGNDLNLSASIGVGIYPDDGDDVQTLIKSADVAMYNAKICGRNNYQFSQTQMPIMKQKKNFYKHELKNALENNELVLFYQPKIDVKTGKIIGVEALIRWARGGERILAPRDFLILAEESKLMQPIGEWVLRTACLQLKKWQKEHDPDLTIAVNISNQQLHTDFTSIIKSILDETHLEPQTLELEVKEEILMTSDNKSIELIKSLRDLNVQLAIDDFGVGYTSFSQLKNYQINTIKIDQSLMVSFPDDPNSKAIISAIVHMAHSLQIKVVAEGVETGHQLENLKSIDCDHYQGYLFSGPVHAENFSQLIKSQEN